MGWGSGVALRWVWALGVIWHVWAAGEAGCSMSQDAARCFLLCPPRMSVQCGPECTQRRGSAVRPLPVMSARAGVCGLQGSSSSHMCAGVCEHGWASCVCQHP